MTVHAFGGHPVPRRLLRDFIGSSPPLNHTWREFGTSRSVRQRRRSWTESVGQECAIALSPSRFGITGHEAAQIILNLAQMFELLADGMEAIRGAAHDALDATGEAEAATAAAREDLFLLLSSHGGVAVAPPVEASGSASA